MDHLYDVMIIRHPENISLATRKISHNLKYLTEL